jgi:hypothetical protein
MTRIAHSIALSVVCIASVSASGQLVTRLSVPGIQPLTSESLIEALDAGEKSGPIANDPMRSRLAEMDRKRVDGSMTASDAARFAVLMEKWPFEFQIITPYSQATTLAAEAKRRFLPRPSVTVDELNVYHQVRIHVSPAGDFTLATSIENVVLKRGSDVVQPVKRAVKPVELRNAVGGVRTVTEGDFTFPIPAFDGSASIVIVFVSPDRNKEWTMTTPELNALK